MKKKHKADYESINPYEDKAPFFVRMEHLARYRWAKEMLRRKKLQRVLDIACADGYGTNELFADGRFVLGADRDKALISKANSRHTNCTFETIDIDKQPDRIRAHAPFDAICSFETLEHLKHPKRALKVFNECLCDDGYLLLSIPDGKYEPKDCDGNIISDFHLHAFSNTRIVKMLDRAGFKIEQVLHQHLGAQLHKNFNLIVRDRQISKQELLKMFPSDEKSL
ncbi:MAG: class I SAM-dependent methyltransferase, partial [Clostridiales bacterium]|nr:class I SAM-dependent methyltransferase [Clostridiales bacterium]